MGRGVLIRFLLGLHCLCNMHLVGWLVLDLLCGVYIIPPSIVKNCIIESPFIMQSINYPGGAQGQYKYTGALHLEDNVYL